MRDARPASCRHSMQDWYRGGDGAVGCSECDEKRTARASRIVPLFALAAAGLGVVRLTAGQSFADRADGWAILFLALAVACLWAGPPFTRDRKP